MKYAYARVSRDKQSEASQMAELTRHGFDRLFVDKISGENWERADLDRLLAKIRPGDEFIVWDIDRLGRTTVELLRFIDELNRRAVKFKSLLQPFLDTTTPHGELIYTIVAAFAQFELKRNRQRTRAGLANARAQNRIGGRPKGLSLEAQKTALAVKQLMASGQFTATDVAKRFGIARSTVYLYRQWEPPAK